MNAPPSAALCLTLIIGLSLLLTLSACSNGESGSASVAKSPDDKPKPAPPDANAPPRRVREPAVAGLFYPADAKKLSATLDKLLAGAQSQNVGKLRALVCPHAGYEYSGPIAASSYKQLAGRDVRTVFLMAPSHYAMFNGVSVLDAEAYRTPLGLVPVSPNSVELAKVKPFRLEPRGGVRRPPWTLRSPKKAGAPEDDTPETWEHSGEVQVPFLQKTLTNFNLVSLVFGQVDPQEAARALASRLDDQTFIVASSDLSHYHPYDEAKNLDTGCVKAVCDLDLARLKDAEACGIGPILTLVHLAKMKGWQTKLLDYRNSGDTAGDKSGVVGYAAIAFFEPESAAQFSADERQQLLVLARRALEDVVRNGKLPEPDIKNFPPAFALPRGCFVTLTKRGELRGCIGNIIPRQPLCQAIMENARAAALNDSRFEPVRPAELGDLEIEVSVLTEPKSLSFTSPDDLLSKLRPNRDGVILKIGFQSATFLPQVWEKIPDKVTFLNHLAQKAGCAGSAWRESGTKVDIYQVEAFGEAKSH
jgi:AmmeMemoRadiSam system protein A